MGVALTKAGDQHASLRKLWLGLDIPTQTARAVQIFGQLDQADAKLVAESSLAALYIAIIYVKGRLAGIMLHTKQSDWCKIQKEWPTVTVT
jgi:hypothetical protein